MTTTRRTNSKSFPDPSPTPVPASASPQDTSAGDNVEVTRVHLPAPTFAYPVVPFEHTTRSHANAAASAQLLADHINGLSVSSRRQLGIILKKWCAFLEVVGIQRTPDDLRTDPVAWGFVS